MESLFTPGSYGGSYRGSSISAPFYQTKLHQQGLLFGHQLIVVEIPAKQLGFPLS